MPTIEEVIQDPDFYQLPEQERMKVMASVDPDFSALPKQEQFNVVKSLKEPPKPASKAKGVSDELQQVIKGMSPYERALTGIGRGFIDIGQGAKQIGLQVGEGLGIIDEGAYDEYTRQIAEEEELYDRPLMEESTAAQVGRFAGNVAATAPIPGGAAASIPARMATAAMAGGASAGLMPTKPGESRMRNVAMGAAGGGVGAGVLGAGGRVVRGVRGDKTAVRAGELAKLSDEFDTPLTVGELRGSPAFQRIEQMLERVPAIGTRGFREGQSKSLSRAAGGLVNRYADVGDVGEELQGSLGRSLQRAKAEAGELYDVVGEEAAKRGGNVPLSNVKATAKGIASRETELPADFQNTKLLDDIQAYANLEDLPFETARKLRSRLGRELSRMQKSAVTGATSDEDVRAISQLYGALEDDIATFATKDGGDLAEAYTKANQFYRENVVPFKDRVVRKAGTDDFDTDQIMTKFIKNDRPQLAAKLMNRLDDKGKAAVKYAVLQDAFDFASEGGAVKVPFSPAKFAGRIEKLGKTRNAIFNEAEKRQIEGFTKLARAAERAGQYAENPPTGQRAVDMALTFGAGGGFIFEPAMMSTAAGASLAFSKLLTSKAGQRLLTRAAGLPPESKAMNRILQVDLPRVLALTAKEVGDEDTQDTP